MNFSKGYNAFSDIPGFDASRGERIVKALQKLWEKIEYLEQIRISERKSGSEITGNSRDEDLTVTDIKYKLLVLQLQYVRSILKKKHNKNLTKVNNDQNPFISDRNCSRKGENFENKTISQETQTGSILINTSDPLKDSVMPENETGSNAQASSKDQALKSEHLFENSASATQKSFPTYSKPHYHLKLDDVPFILGASSTASHSVVANVQNIIAMMKSHNKALCGPKHHVTRSSAINPQSTHSVKTQSAEDLQDATKMLDELSKDLYKLTLKQQRLVKTIDAAQGKNQAFNLVKHFQKEDKVNKVSDKHIENRGARKRRSNSESEIKLHAEVKYFPKMKEKDFAKYNIQQKQISSVRGQPSNLSIMGRRNLLRSLQNFKTHLSEEDISWN